jgi:hypothetical protein
MQIKAVVLLALLAAGCEVKPQEEPDIEPTSYPTGGPKAVEPFKVMRIPDDSVTALIRYDSASTRTWNRMEVDSQLRTLVIGIDHRWSYAEIDTLTSYRSHLTWDDGAVEELARACEIVFGIPRDRPAFRNARTVKETRGVITTKLRQLQRFANDIV